MNARTFFIFMMVIGCWKGWEHWRLRTLYQAPGVLVKEDPVQRDVSGTPPVFEKNGYTMTAQASYRIRGRLLHRENYYTDASSGISPIDFGLGWGPMSDSTILDKIQFSQSVRFLDWRWEGREPPIPFDILNSHASNNHLIPASATVFDALNTMREGQVVELDGYLVSIKGPKGFTWNGSLTRTDTGAGACEVMYVQYARVIQERS